jgi:membrane protein YqaA with SNARE-associated domain
MRRLYNWVLNWADSPYSVTALFLLAFTESVFFPVPPDVLLIALALGAAGKAFRYALICTVGSVSGAMVGYALGSFIWVGPEGEFSQVALFFFNNIPGFSEGLFNNIKSLFNNYDFWVIFTAGFTPIPYKVFTISAGVFDLNILMFLIASLVSRGARFFLVAWLIWRFGPGIKSFIEKYLNWLAIGITVGIIGIVVTLNILI